MKNKNKILIYSIVGVALLILLVVGATYAYFDAANNDNNIIQGGTADKVKLELKINKLSTSASEKLIPLDNDINSLTAAAKGYSFSGTTYDKTKSCIDKNGYSVCQVYEIKVTNNGSATVALSGGVTHLKGEKTPNLACAVMESNINVTNNSTCLTSTSLANNVKLPAGEEKKYYIIVYINNLHTEQYDVGEYNGIVTFSSLDGKLTANFS